MDDELYAADRFRRPALAKRRLQMGRWAAGVLVVLIAILVAVLHMGEDVVSLKELAALGYFGVFLTMLISGASIFFPVLGQAAILAAGALWNPLLVGLAAGLGNATGELTGYVAGQAGAAAFGRRQSPHWLSSLQRWLRRYGFFAVLLLSVIPNPVFDAIGILAGSLSCPSVRYFWLACAIGNSIKYIGIAYLGGFAVGWLG